MKNIESWIVLPDTHVPFHDERCLKAVEKFIAVNTFHGYLCLGDFIDNDIISDFNKDKPRKKEGRRILADYDAANKILDRHQMLIWDNNPYAKFVMIEGNHEERMERYIDEHPELEGMIDVHVGLRLEQRGFKWVRHWSKGEVFTIGKANFIHGKYLGKNHAIRTATEYGGSMFYGHTHDMQCNGIAGHLNPEKMHVGQSLGCLCIRDQSYMRSSPSVWQQGFAVFYFRPDGNYSYYPIRIIDGKFTWIDGKTYNGDLI